MFVNYWFNIDDNPKTNTSTLKFSTKKRVKKIMNLLV